MALLSGCWGFSLHLLLESRRYHPQGRPSPWSWYWYRVQSGWALSPGRGVSTLWTNSLWRWQHPSQEVPEHSSYRKEGQRPQYRCLLIFLTCTHTLSIHLPIHLSIYLSIHLYIHLSIHLSDYPPACLSTYLPIYLFRVLIFYHLSILFYCILTGPIKFREGVVTFSNVLQLIFTSDL